MEKLNLDFSNYFYITKSLLWILSILSWLFYICTGWVSIYFFHNSRYEMIWTIEKMGMKENSIYTIREYYPIQINTVLIYIIFLITLLFATAGFIIYILKTTCLKEDNIYDGMMDIWPRLHSFPLILVSFLFLLGEYFFPYYYNIYTDKNGFQDYSKYFNHMKDIRFFGLLFALMALISLIFIYIVTDLKTDCWYIVLTIKKGAYSSLIILLWYYFWYMVYQVNEYIYPTMFQKTRRCLKKAMGISLSIIIGLGSLFFSYIFKDVVAASMNLLIYLGMCIYFLKIKADIREYYNNKLADGIIDIIMTVLSLLMIVFLVIKHREECLKS